MPELIAGYLIPLLVQAGAVGVFGFAGTAAIALGASYLLLAGGAYLLASAFTTAPQTPEAPKPEDGKYNLKQSVPPLVYVLGKVKKAGDYDFLEERGGIAYHITVWAAHHIKGFVGHYLHDELAALDNDGIVVGPQHFGGFVSINTRLGDAASTAYSEVVAAFPEIWTNDHRGDGLATVRLLVQSVAAENLQKTFPSGMPQHSAVGEGNDELFDPRTGQQGYSENIALFRYWHLTHPVGGKLTREDLYPVDWARAADVGDQTVVNRLGEEEPRYHGGMWFRAKDGPVQVGRLMDQAADMVIYERPDGKIGVHAGEFVEPDVRLTAEDIISCGYDPNRRKGSTVLAVRGRFTDPAKGYNTVDAAIIGNPYPTDDERTKSVENQAVQRHNHIQRLQELARIRANAPRVTIRAHYGAARKVPYRRFVRVHLPPRLNEAVVEIIGRPTLSLRTLSYQFEGIVVPATLYAFDAATQEGVPTPDVGTIERDDVPVPINFNVTVLTESVGGGTTAAYAEASVTLQNATFQYELEWEPAAGGTPQSVLGIAGQTNLRSGYLVDGTDHRFRVRTWSAGVPSDWTDYEVRSVTSDPVAPGPVTGVTATGGTGQITFNWTAPNSPNYFGARLYWNTSNTFAGSTLGATEYGAPNAADSRVVTGISAGTRYGFVVAINASGVEATPVATGAKVVS